MRLNLIRLLRCPLCGDSNETLRLSSLAEAYGSVIDGVLVCAGCRARFPICDRVLELVAPELVDASSLRTLHARHGGQARDLGLPAAASGTDRPDDRFAAQLAQRAHFDEYATNASQDYKQYAALPCWQAIDARTFADWHGTMVPGTQMLDVGCADGRSAFPFVDRHRIVGFDISRRMIARAVQEAERRGCLDRCTFFVADGSRLPFANASFAYVQTYGVLHHLPEPGRVVHEIQRILEPGGIHFGSENNRSGLRWLFDMLMRLLPIWREEAGEQPLIDDRLLAEWTAGLPVAMTTRTIVFVPPQLLNLASPRLARRVLDATDTLATAFPPLRRHGGLLVFEIRKLS